MILIAVFVGTLTVLAAVIVTRPETTHEARETPVALAAATATNTVATDSTTAGADPAIVTNDPTPIDEATSDVEPTEPAAPTEPPHPTAVDVQQEAESPPLPSVAKPELLAPTGIPSAVHGYYSETYEYEGFTIAWRPGAFPPERAAEVASEALRARDRVNQMLGLNDTAPMTIYLADRMFDESCIGCQGYAAADFRQIFILQDGSVAPDEFPSLLIHEVGHVLALNIAEPEKLFFAEGLAVWISDEAIRDAGYISAIQTAAWAYKAGTLPSIPELLEAQYEGRVRARVEYDGAASFTKFFIDTYGLDAYKTMYDLVASERTGPETIVNTDWATLEEQWYAWLLARADEEFNGADATEWWLVGRSIAAGFGALYDNPGPVTVEQYAALSAARLELNRGNLDAASTLANSSNLTPRTAN